MPRMSRNPNAYWESVPGTDGIRLVARTPTGVQMFGDCYSWEDCCVSVVEAVRTGAIPAGEMVSIVELASSFGVTPSTKTQINPTGERMVMRLVFISRGEDNQLRAISHRRNHPKNELLREAFGRFFDEETKGTQRV